MIEAHLSIKKKMVLEKYSSHQLNAHGGYPQPLWLPAHAITPEQVLRDHL
jgi:hypothetical protein